MNIFSETQIDLDSLNQLPDIREAINNADVFNANMMYIVAHREMMLSDVSIMDNFSKKKFSACLIKTFIDNKWLL